MRTQGARPRVAVARGENGGLLSRGRIAAALAAICGGVIIVNAVALQNEKHPSPLFRSVVRAPEVFPLPPARPEPVQAAAARPAPEKARAQAAPALPSETADPLIAGLQQELSRRGYFKGEANGRPGPGTTQAIRDFQFAQRLPVDGKPSEALLHELLAAKATMKDELLDLVKKASGQEKPTRTVADVQRALNKAGYGPLTEDGHMGPSTRTALARFEADRKLPPRGEPKGPVLKVLASVSGVAIAQ